MKKCSKCSIEQPLANFHKKKERLDGLSSQCKACKKAKYKTKFKSKKTPKLYNKATCAVVNCNNKRKTALLCDKHWYRYYYHGDTSYNDQYKKPCQIEDCKNLAGYQGLCRKHKEKKDNLQKRLSGYKKKHERSYRARINQTKRSAYAVGRDFLVTTELCMQIMTENTCTFCKGPLPQTRVGLDRIDNTIGYIDSNVQPCCALCNSVKSDKFTTEEFKEIVETKAYKNLLQRGYKFKYSNKK